jgi:hypothetical protein
MRLTSFRNEFVEYLPEELSEGTLYISLSHRTVAHLCACGCRQEVVTPLAPSEWVLFFDGVSVSLHPSIGNWNFSCRSHYFIRNSKVSWAGDMNKNEIERVRKLSQAERGSFAETKAGQTGNSTGSSQNMSWPNSLWERIRKLFTRR